MPLHVEEFYHIAELKDSGHGLACLNVALTLSTALTRYRFAHRIEILPIFIRQRESSLELALEFHCPGLSQ